jgi:hypothetical protein
MRVVFIPVARRELVDGQERLRCLVWLGIESV